MIEVTIKVEDEGYGISYSASKDVPLTEISLIMLAVETVKKDMLSKVKCEKKQSILSRGKFLEDD